jgi:TolA-binding protein
MKRIACWIGMVAIAAGTALAQDLQEQVDRALQEAKAAQKLATKDAVKAGIDKLASKEIQDQIDRAIAQADKIMPDIGDLQDRLNQIGIGKFDPTGGFAFDDLKFKLDGLMAFQDDRAQEARERQQEARERAQEERERQREMRDRTRESEDREISFYRDGTDSVDDHRYERAIDRFDRVIADKWSRADGAFYWKAYALSKLGKRDEALAVLAEIPKQFPQSRWINDANALKVEIQQASGNPVSPENLSGEDLKLLAINALMNSDADRAIPLLEKVLNDPKNNLGLKSRALFVLAQNRSDKGREIVTQYAKSGANPDLQIRAIGYLGSFRTKDSQQALADVYAANNDVAIRRAVLRSMGSSRDVAHLFAAAKSESNADLRREAIRSLGNMQASNELAQLYATETANDLKDAILSALMVSRASDKLLDLAKSEKNPELRGDAIRYLGTMRNEHTADALASLYAGETDKNVKEQIIRGLGQQGAGKQLVDITRNEKDPELKRDEVQWLGRMRGSKEATDYLMELLK